MTVTESFAVRMKNMGFNRVERIQEEYKRELSSIIRTIKDPRMSSMVSVVSANVTKDLKKTPIMLKSTRINISLKIQASTKNNKPFTSFSD